MREMDAHPFDVRRRLRAPCRSFSKRAALCYIDAK